MNGNDHNPEDIHYFVGVVQKVTDDGLGGRGIDAIYVTQSGSTTSSYPIFDAHGNMISTLTKQGTGGYQFSALRTFDAWGNIRLGAQTGDPKGRYCANLGHKQDDESGLVYMRARYYEPGSGRFANQDPSMAGTNWFAYANQNPVLNADATGRESFGGPVLDLIKTFLKAWGIEIKDLPKCDQIFAAILDSAVKIAEHLGAANIMFGLAQWSMEGMTAGKVFGGNPVFAGICGAGAAVGVLGGGLFLLGCVLELRNLALEIYTICAMEGE